MRFRSNLAGAVASAVIALAPGAPAFAQGPSSSKVAAESLFEDARQLVTVGKVAEACPKFADSQRLDPSVATLLNLANCWEKLGRTATAWATYREAASAADAAGRKDYLATALRRADALAPKLARLTVTVTQPVPAGMVVKRDGAPMDAAEWGLAIPVDAGPHAIEAVAPGHKPWTSTVAVAQDAVQAAIMVPVLEPSPAEAAPPPPPSPPAPVALVVAPAPLVSPDVPASGGGGQRIVGALLAGVGVAGLAASVVAAVIAKNRYSDSLVHCEAANPDLCDTQGLSIRDDARTDGNVATVALAVGGAAALTGAILWLTAPRGADRPAGAAIFVAPTLGGATVNGAW